MSKAIEENRELQYKDLHDDSKQNFLPPSTPVTVFLIAEK